MLLLFSGYWKVLQKEHALLFSSLKHSRILWECPSPRYFPGRSLRAVWFCPQGLRRPLPDTDPRAPCFGKTGMSAWQRCCWLPLFPSRHRKTVKQMLSIANRSESWNWHGERSSNGTHHFVLCFHICSVYSVLWIQFSVVWFIWAGKIRAIRLRYGPKQPVKVRLDPS